MKTQKVKDITPHQMQKIVDGFGLEDNEIRNFTVNEVIHAYKTGFDMGLSSVIEQNEKLLEKQIRANAAAAAQDTSKVVEYFKQIGIRPLSAHLKIASKFSVEVLITVSDEDYVKEEFNQVYAFVNALIESNTNELYSINFKFINRGESFDLDAVKTDGYASSFRPLETK
jgi:hypothetical protein